MKPIPNFPTTQWTRLEANQNSPEARDWFCETYRPAVFAYLRMRYEHYDAEDLCQEFFAKVVLARDLLGKADRTRGTLRGFLLSSLDNFLINQHRRAQSKKRGGGAVHDPLTGNESASSSLQFIAGGEAPDAAFDRAWAANLLERAILATEADFKKKRKSHLFEALRPMLDGMGPHRRHAEIAAQLGMKTSEITLALTRLRQRVGAHLYNEVARTVAGTDSMATEWETIRKALENR